MPQPADTTAHSTAPAGPAPGSTATERGPEPKQERAVRTKAHVLRTAGLLFAAHGYARTSVKDVADASGVTKGAVYFHFPTKEQLAISVVEYQYLRWPPLADEVRALGLNPLDAVCELLHRVATAFRDDLLIRGGVRLQAERSLINAPLPTPYLGWSDLLTEMFTAAYRAGELRAGVTPDAAARVFVAGFFGTQHISDILNQREDLGERLYELLDILVAGIRA